MDLGRQHLDATNVGRTVSLFERTKTSGAIRSDIEVDDIAFVLEQIAMVRVLHRDRTLQLRHRYLALHLDALHGDGSTLPGPPPTWAESANAGRPRRRPQALSRRQVSELRFGSGAWLTSEDSNQHSPGVVPLPHTSTGHPWPVRLDREWAAGRLFQLREDDVSYMSAADRGTGSLAGRVVRQSKDKPAHWMALRKLPNCRRIVFSEGRIAASVQLSAVGRRPRWLTKSQRAATASSSLASARSEIRTASPSNTPGGFVLWELRSTTTTPGIHQAKRQHVRSGAMNAAHAAVTWVRTVGIGTECTRCPDCATATTRRASIIPGVELSQVRCANRRTARLKREVGEMERSNLMQPGAGHPIGGGIVLKVGAQDLLGFKESLQHPESRSVG